MNNTTKTPAIETLLAQRDALGVAEEITRLQFLGASTTEFRGIGDTKLSVDVLNQCLTLVMDAMEAGRPRRNSTLERCMDAISAYLDTAYEEDEA